MMPIHFNAAYTEKKSANLELGAGLCSTLSLSYQPPLVPASCTAHCTNSNPNLNQSETNPEPNANFKLNTNPNCNADQGRQVETKEGKSESKEAKFWHCHKWIHNSAAQYPVCIIRPWITHRTSHRFITRLTQRDKQPATLTPANLLEL